MRNATISTLIVIALSCAVSGQTPTGMPPFGSFTGGPIDTIDLANLNVHFTFPIVSKPGRGIPFAYQLNYDSSLWSVIAPGTCCAAWWNGGTWGWLNEANASAGYVVYNSVQQRCFSQTYQEWYYYNRLTYRTYYDASNTPHPFYAAVYDSDPCNNGLTLTATATTTDQSGYTVSVNEGAATVFPRSGGTLIPTPNTPSGVANASDSNGNKITSSDGLNFTDTLGQPVLAISGTPSGGSVTYTYGTTAGPSTASITVGYHQYTIQTAFNCSGVAENNTPNVWLPVSVSRPDGTSYGIQYEQTPGYGSGYTTGRVSQITLPAGATISYVYGYSNDPNHGINCSDESTRYLTRTIAGNVDAAGTWTYFRNGPTYVTDAANNVTAVTFQGLYETERQIYQGPSAVPAALVETIHTCYNGASYPCTTTSIAPPITQKTMTTVLGGLYKQSTNTYNSSLGMLLNSYEYDFGSGAPGALLRETDTAYATITVPSTGQTISDRPRDIVVKNGSGTRVAETQIDYDGISQGSCSDNAASLTGTSGVPQHDYRYFGSSMNSRGNATTVCQWISGSTWNRTSNTYNDAGNLLSTSTPNQNTTTYSYSTNVANGFVTQTQLPTTGSVQHLVKASYDVNTGLMVSFTDQNNQTTSYTYDSMSRPLSVTFPATSAGTAQTTYSYPNADTVSRSETMNTSTNLTSTMVVDGLGRTHQTQLTSDTEGTDYVDTSYNALGQVNCASNPHRSGSASTDGSTCYAYDELGRVTSVTHPDGNAVQTSYSTNCATVTDELGNTHQNCVDGLGRLTEAVEQLAASSPNPGTGLATVGGSEQTIGATSGTGSVAISGQEASVQNCGETGRCTWYYDIGTVTITINGTSYNATYSGGSTSSSIASALSTAINNGSLAVATASGSTVYITSIAKGPGANYSLSGSSQTSRQSTFGSPSFYASPSGSSLTGGINSSDTGTVSISVNGYQASTSYGSSSTTSGLAAALANIFNGDPNSPVTAIVSGATVSLTAKARGSASNYSLSVSAATTNGYFSQPSFTMSDSGSSLTGGADTGQPINIPTFYSYDPLGNLTCVEQHGNVNSTGCSADPSNDANSLWRIRRFSYDGLSGLLNEKHPESGTTTYSYDGDGNLISKTDARGLSITYYYDPLDRLTKKTYSDDSSWNEWYYDASGQGQSIGRLTHSSNDVNAAENFYYDAMGNLTQETYCLPSDCSYGTSVQAAYNLAGNLTSLTYPDGRTVKTSYNSANRVLNQTYDNWNGSPIGYQYLSVASHAPTGDWLTVNYGNGLQQANSLNSRLQPTEIKLLQNGTSIWDKQYGWYSNSKNNGNVWNIVDGLNADRNQYFNYDYMNRITSGYQNDGSFNQTFSPDAWGNLQQSGTWNFNQSYTQFNQLSGYSYDAAGNLLNDTFHGYAYDIEGRMKTVDSGASSYTYDGLGLRVRKDTPSGWTEYVYFGGQAIAEKSTNGWNDYVFANGSRLAQTNSSAPSSTAYYYTDHLGSARLMTDVNGNVTWQATYAPFGQEANPQSTTNHYKFTGDERDSESNLDHTAFRQYEATQGRWLSPDPAGLAAVDITNPQSFNRYAYVLNNPLRFIDPTGLWHCSWNAYSGDGSDIDPNPADGGATQAECFGQGGEAWVSDPGDTVSNMTATIWSPAVLNDMGDPGTGVVGFGSGSSTSPLDSSAGDVAIDLDIFHCPGCATTWNSAYSWGQAAFVGTGVAIAAPFAAGALAAAPGVATNLAARGAGWYYAYAGTGTGVVLGRYNEYLEAAEAMGARALNANPRIYSFFNAAGEWWTLNRAYLNAQIYRGEQFFLSNAPLQQESSGFTMELEYLSSKGIGPGQWQYVPLPYIWY